MFISVRFIMHIYIYTQSHFTERRICSCGHTCMYSVTCIAKHNCTIDDVIVHDGDVIVFQTAEIVTRERVSADELIEARQTWVGHVRGVARKPRDPLEPM